MVNGAGSARPRFVFDVGGAVAAVAGRVLNARSPSRALKGARAPGEPSAAAAGVGRAGLVLNGAAPPGAALTSAAGASRLIGGAERRTARAAVRANIPRHDRCFRKSTRVSRWSGGLRKALCCCCPGRSGASCKTLASTRQPSESHILRDHPSRGLAATPQPRPTKAALEEFCQTRQEVSKISDRA